MLKLELDGQPPVKLLEVGDVAKWLDVTPTNVLGHIYRKNLRAIQLTCSGIYLIEESELLRFIEHRNNLTLVGSGKGRPT